MDDTPTADGRDDEAMDVGPGPVPDEPSPRVTAIYLRPVRPVDAQVVSAHPSDTLVDEISRIVCGMLERHVRESVTAAVRALAPRLVVTFPEPEGPGPRSRAPGQQPPRPARPKRERGPKHGPQRGPPAPDDG